MQNRLHKQTSQYKKLVNCSYCNLRQQKGPRRTVTFLLITLHSQTSQEKECDITRGPEKHSYA